MFFTCQYVFRLFINHSSIIWYKTTIKTLLSVFNVCCLVHRVRVMELVYVWWYLSAATCANKVIFHGCIPHSAKWNASEFGHVRKISKWWKDLRVSVFLSVMISFGRLEEEEELRRHHTAAIIWKSQFLWSGYPLPPSSLPSRKIRIFGKLQKDEDG